MSELPRILTFDSQSSSSKISITIRENKCCFDSEALDEFSDNAVKGRSKKELIILRFITQAVGVKQN
jgi:hypothetical protein